MKADAIMALIVDDGVLLAFGREKIGVVTFATFKHIVACFAVEGVIACFAERRSLPSPPLMNRCHHRRKRCRRRGRC